MIEANGVTQRANLAIATARQDYAVQRSIFDGFQHCLSGIWVKEAAGM